MQAILVFEKIYQTKSHKQRVDVISMRVPNKFEIKPGSKYLIKFYELKFDNEADL